MIMSEYIEFEVIDKKPRTLVYSVINIKSEMSLGTIQWHGAWRQYCFFPIPYTIFNIECMEHIIKFIQKLMEERKH